MRTKCGCISNPGSPPQVRGKHCRCLVVIRLVRITPAGAGKTGIQFRTRTVDEDHPRRCGENDLRLVRATYAIGSPPQVRGKLYCFACGVGGDGITPAGAGKTAVVKQAAAIAWDHPRRCGENVDTPAEETETDRITPAGAGKTCFSVAGAEPQRDHPRRCGENSISHARSSA